MKRFELILQKKNCTSTTMSSITSIAAVQVLWLAFILIQ